MFRRNMPPSWRSYSFEIQRAAKRRERWEAMRGLLIVVVLALLGGVAAMLVTMAVVR